MCVQGNMRGNTHGPSDSQFSLRYLHTHGPENLHAWLNEFARQAGKVSGRGVQGMSQNGQL